MVSRINVTVSEVAKDVLSTYKKEHGFSNLDSALDALLMESAGSQIRLKPIKKDGD